MEKFSPRTSTADSARDPEARGAATPRRLAPPAETAAASLSLAYRRDGPEVVVEVRGELDLATVGHLERAVGDLIDDQRCRSVVLDLHGLEFIGSAGLCVLLRAQQHARSKGSKVTLMRLSPIARRSMEICGLLSTFEMREP